MGSCCSQVLDVIIGISEWRNIEVREPTGCDQESRRIPIPTVAAEQMKFGKPTDFV